MAILIVVCLAAWSAHLALIPPVEPGSTRQNFVRLRAGMQYEEVVEILGPPSRGWRVTMGHCYWWSGDDFEIALAFSDASFGDMPHPIGLLQGKMHVDGIVLEMTPKENSMIEFLRRQGFLPQPAN
jgi:hypothetical protein